MSFKDKKKTKKEQQKSIIFNLNRKQPCAFVPSVASVQGFPGFCLFLRVALPSTKLWFSQRGKKNGLMFPAYMNPPGAAGRLSRGI